VHTLNENKKPIQIGGESIFTAISVGFFFVLAGALFVTTPNLFDNILDFFKSFELADVPNTDIIFPVPASPSTHTVLYQVVVQFSFALAIFHIVLLALRFFSHSPWGKRAETVGNLVYWLGAGFLVQNYLLSTPTQWFVFWSLLIIIIGISLIARAIVMAVARF
jgi:hypothetical protein